MKKYLMSVDVGGTKTEFYLSDLNGRMIYSTKVGSGSYKSIGLKIARENIEKGVNLICQIADTKVSDIAYSVWGVSGCDSEDDFELMKTVIETIGFEQGNYTLLNDALMAYYGVAQGQGMAVIAGTGSIVFGIDEKGQTSRTGGWGYNFSDLGSGQWLGNEVLKEVLLYCDGCISYVPWFEDVREHFGVADFYSLPYIITGIQEYSLIADLSSILFSNSEEALAQSILRLGAKYLASMMVANYNKISSDENKIFSIVLFGGCLKQKCYRDILIKALPDVLKRENVKIMLPQISPAEGGLNLAQKLYLKNKQKGKGVL